MAASIPDLIQAAAQQYGVDVTLAHEVAMAESGMNQSAIGPVTASGERAIGVMQLLPGTAAELGVDPTDTAQNVDGGVRYLAQLMAQFGGDPVAAVAAYDWGPGSVSKAIAAHGPAWLASAPAETQAYVVKVLGNVSQWTASPSPPSGDTTSAPPSPVSQAQPSTPAAPSAAPQGADVTTVLVLTAIGLLFLWASSESFS